MSKNSKDNEEKTYMSKGMLWGVALGGIIGSNKKKINKTKSNSTSCLMDS